MFVEIELVSDKLMRKLRLGTKITRTQYDEGRNTHAYVLLMQQPLQN